MYFVFLIFLICFLNEHRLGSQQQVPDCAICVLALQHSYRANNETIYTHLL